MSEIILTELEKYIIHLNTAYREGRPEVTDWEYDEFIERLKTQQPNSELLKKAIIEKTKESRKITLPFSMMSLEKEKMFENVITWANKIKKEFGEKDSDPLLVITPKLDGISLLNDKGVFMTRGDGFIGQNCTEHCKFIESSSLPIKGELVIINKIWETQEVFRKYKHPRNTVSGWINGDYDSNIPYNYMTFFAYDILNDNCSKIEKLVYLNDNCNVANMLYTTLTLSELTHNKLKLIFEHWKKSLPIDGLVIEFNDVKYRIGTHPNGNPKYMLAYKHPSFSEIAKTKITKVNLAVNRYGVITPNIEFEPVNISGAKLSAVNGVNMSYIYDWGLFPGEEIEVVRSGEVIPKIISVGGINIPFIDDFVSSKEYELAYSNAQFKRERDDNFINITSRFADENIHCPYCETTLVWDENYTNQICINENCSERRFQQIVDFFKIFEVENIAEGTLRSLYEKGFNSVKKILDITEEELLQIDGFAEKSSRDFVSAMKVLKEKGGPLAKHMHALGYFPNLGEKTLQLIIDSREDGDVFSKAELLKVNGIGEKTAEIFLNGLPYFLNRGRLGIFVTYTETPKREKKEGIFSGNILCFTGCRPTDELREKLENAGAEISENFTSRVTHLVTKDLNSTSSKIEKARKSGITICSLFDLN